METEDMLSMEAWKGLTMGYKREYTVSKAVKFVKSFGDSKEFLFISACDEDQIREQASQLGYDNLTDKQMDDIIGHMENADTMESGINYAIEAAVWEVMDNAK